MNFTNVIFVVMFGIYTYVIVVAASEYLFFNSQFEFSFQLQVVLTATHNLTIKVAKRLLPR